MRSFLLLLPTALTLPLMPPARAGSFTATYSGGTYTGYGYNGTTAAFGTWPYALGTYTISGVNYY